MSTELPKQLSEKPKESGLNYEPFDPEVELKLIKAQKGNRETRVKKLKRYKEELINQKEGIAEIQTDLEKQIRVNPDISQKALMNFVLSQAPNYRLSENQLNLFKKTLDNYTKRHQIIERVQEKYPDDRELFRACFGKYPEGKIELIKSPITIYFRCYNIQDYAWIYEEKFLAPENEKGLKKAEIKSAKKTDGKVIHNCLIVSLNGLITAENATGALKKVLPKTKKVAFEHEEQHVIKNLFEEQLIMTPAVKEFINSPSLEKLISYLRFLRKNCIEGNTKNEILAYYKQGGYTLKDIEGTLLKPEKRGGLYDYYNSFKKDIEKIVEEKLTPEIYKKNKERIEENLKQVFVDEYEQETTRALNAIKDLKKMGQSKNEIVHLLITEPLGRWDKLVKRIKTVKSTNYK